MSFLDGLALAATVAADRKAEAARSGLVPALAAGLEVRLAELSAAPDRAAALGALTRAVRPPIDPRAELGARAAALLSTEVPRTLGARWLAAAPPLRAGFRAAAALRATARRHAGPPLDPAQRARDRAAGVALVRDALGPGGLEADAVLAPLDAADRAAVQAAVAPAAVPAHVALVRLALDAGAGGDLLAAVGAMARGDAEAREDRWARAGAECAPYLGSGA